MRIHVLNCGTMRPRGARIFIPDMSFCPCLCLLIENEDRLILVDTGLGTRDMEDPYRRLGYSNVLLNAQRDKEQTALRQIKVMGFNPSQVTDIICTHLDRDHAGGLFDFPEAKVHVIRIERDSALDPPTLKERERYRKCHFSHNPKWVTHEATSSQDWFGMECIREIDGLPPEIVLIPLPGHTRGHCGVAVKDGNGWLLHCGDTYYTSKELAEGEKAPLGVRCFRSIAHMNHAAAMLQLNRIRTLLRERGDQITTIATHDWTEYSRRFRGNTNS